MTNTSISSFRPKQKMTRSIQIKMTKDQYDFMSFASKKLNMSYSDIVRTSLTEYFDKHL